MELTKQPLEAAKWTLKCRRKLKTEIAGCGIILHGPLTRSLRPAVWTGSAYSASVQAPSAVYVAITDLRVVNFKPRQTIHVLNARHYQTGI